MKHTSQVRRVGTIAGMVALTAVLGAHRSHDSGFITGIKPYAVPTVGSYRTHALLSVGDRVPETSDPSKLYQMVGIPDGLGAHKNDDGTVTVYLNHELPGAAIDTEGTRSEPNVGGALNRGAFVSKYILGRDGSVLSGERAYDKVFIDDTYIGLAAEVGNTTPPFARFCSASLAGREHGFDRPIYFANEESGGAATFDGTGGLAVAIFDNEAHGLPYLGRFAWENTLVQPNRFGKRVVIMGMEDGPASQVRTDVNSQLYMYIGEKDYSAGASVLERNGLVGGTLYVFRSKDASKNSEVGLQDGSIKGEWVAIPAAHTMSDVQLEAASDLAGAMIFARPEDGAFNPRNRHEYFFVTTGGAAGANVLGRLYSLHLNPFNPTGDAVLSVVYNADQVVAGGGDIALSPDNIDASGDYLMVQEDGTTESRAVMTTKKRDGSIWRFKLSGWGWGKPGVSAASAKRIVSLAPPGRDNAAVLPGIWETSGIIDTTRIFGKDSWLFDVQAHPPTAVPQPNTVEDGQLLLLVPDHRGWGKGHDKDDDEDDDEDDDKD